MCPYGAPVSTKKSPGSSAAIGTRSPSRASAPVFAQPNTSSSHVRKTACVAAVGRAIFSSVIVFPDAFTRSPARYPANESFVPLAAR